MPVTLILILVEIGRFLGTLASQLGLQGELQASEKYCLKSKVGIHERIHQGQVLAAKPSDLNSIPGSQMVEGVVL